MNFGLNKISLCLNICSLVTYLRIIFRQNFLDLVGTPKKYTSTIKFCYILQEILDYLNLNLYLASKALWKLQDDQLARKEKFYFSKAHYKLYIGTL